MQSTSERLGLERRADWFSRLTPEKQRAWLDGMSDRVRSQALPTIDEHVHPSHVVEAIREEPRYIQLLVIKHLRPILTVFVAEALGLGAAANPPALNARQPVPEIISVVRRTFMSHFVSAAELATPTALDLLSSAELARLVRLLGVCEIALACRSIPAKETVAAFLRRFSAEDARAIAAYISTLTNIEPQRVRLAEESVREALQTEDEPAAMLDRTGLHLLALRFAGHDETRLRYTAQKFPLEIALWLRMRAAEATSNLNAFSRDICPQQAREIVLRIGHETEALAEGVKRGTLQAGD
ncbi:MAG: hypothetical protein ABW250_13075 [Pyrinomonadaceae bacterium]